VKISQRRARGLVAAAIAVSVIAGPVIASMPAQAATELTFWSWRTEDKAFYEEQLGIFKERCSGLHSEEAIWSSIRNFSYRSYV